MYKPHTIGQISDLVVGCVSLPSKTFIFVVRPAWRVVELSGLGGIGSLDLFYALDDAPHGIFHTIDPLVQMAHFLGNGFSAAGSVVMQEETAKKQEEYGLQKVV